MHSALRAAAIAIISCIIGVLRAQRAAFVPGRRTYDPDTGWDWEGRGVAPDLQVPADQALEVALARARER